MRLSCLIFIFLILISNITFAQNSRSELEQRRKSILESLKASQSQLEATKSDRKANMSQLKALQAKINTREKLIANINQEIEHLNKNIQNSNQEVEALKKNLQLQKLRYAQSIRYAYTNRSNYNTLTFIFSAQDFNEALRRLKYLKKYRDFRKNQVSTIKNTQTQLVQKIGSLNETKNSKGQLLNTEQQQNSSLLAEKTETSKIVDELKGREKELAVDIENKKKTTRRLDNAISEAIRKEIEIARKKAEEEARKKRLEEERKAAALAAAKQAKENDANVYGTGPNKVTLAGSAKYDLPNNPSTTNTSTTKNNTSKKPEESNFKPVATTVNNNAATHSNKNNYVPVTTPEVSALSKEFEANRGRLPWPVSSGVIVDPFGKHKHAIASRVEIENNGIDIQTQQGGKARAVFEGKVTTVMGLQGIGQTVIINHGAYFTVYSGLKDVQVKVGETVDTKQILGTVNNNEDGAPVMNFQVWKGANKMNPSSWISPM